MWAIFVGLLALCSLVAAQVDPRCNGVKISNGVGYLPHPSRCDCWIRCTFTDEKTITSQQNCAGCGLFWDQQLLTNVPASDKSCTNDLCAPANVNNYAFVGNCRSYWTCNGARTQGTMCCAADQRYNAASQSCVADPGQLCKQRCVCDEQTSAKDNCTFRWNPNDPHTYFVDEHEGLAPVAMACAPGTNFNRSTCKCSDFVALSQPTCPLDLHINCLQFPIADVANQAWIYNQNVGISGTGHCIFDGTNSRLMLPRYANQDWREDFAISAEFDGENNANDDVAIYSNTECADETPTLEIRLLRSGGSNNPVVQARIETGQVYTLSAPYRVNQRNSVYLSYDGATFRFSIKYSNDNTVERRSVAASGIVKRLHCAMQVGFQKNNKYFDGNFYDGKFYINCIPANFQP